MFNLIGYDLENFLAGDGMIRTTIIDWMKNANVGFRLEWARRY